MPPQEGKEAGLWSQVTPDPATLVAQMGTRGLQPLLAGANPAQGDPQSARGRAGRGLALGAEDPRHPPHALTWNEVPSPTRRPKGKD